MAQVRFIGDFDYWPTKQVLIAYRADTEKTVRRECANQAIAAGKAVEVPKTRKVEDDGENIDPQSCPP